VQVVCERRRGARRERDTRYFITSLPRTRADAARLLAIIRSHWGVIENGLHWVRDVVWREDRSTISTGHAPQNFAALRNAALACLRADASRNLAATLRSHYRKPQRLFTKLGLLD
jgi:predicted transposase YbfD/YdcC